MDEKNNAGSKNDKQVGNGSKGDLLERVKELEESWKRAVADLRNVKKRAEKEKADFAAYANQRLLTALLPVLDALRKAEEQLDKEDGIGYIRKQLNKILKDEGVEEIGVVKGDNFDPELMQTVNTQKTEHKEKKDTVAEVYRTGYKYKDRILRAAEVKVYI